MIDRLCLPGEGKTDIKQTITQKFESYMIREVQSSVEAYGMNITISVPLPVGSEIKIKLLNLSKAHFLLCKVMANNNTCFIDLVWGLIFLKHLVQCLTHNKHPINVNCNNKITWILCYHTILLCSFSLLQLWLYFS